MSNQYPDEITPDDLQTPEDRQAAQDIVQAAAAHWRTKAIEAFPNVKPLEDYLNGSSEAEVMALAEELSGKLGPAEQRHSPTVPGGLPALPSNMPGSEEAEAEDLKRASRQGNAEAGAALMALRRKQAGWPF